MSLQKIDIFPITIQGTITSKYKLIRVSVIKRFCLQAKPKNYPLIGYKNRAKILMLVQKCYVITKKNQGTFNGKERLIRLSLRKGFSVQANRKNYLLIGLSLIIGLSLRTKYNQISRLGICLINIISKHTRFSTLSYMIRKDPLKNKLNIFYHRCKSLSVKYIYLKGLHNYSTSTLYIPSFIGLTSGAFGGLKRKVFYHLHLLELLSQNVLCSKLVPY